MVYEIANDLIILRKNIDNSDNKKKILLSKFGSYLAILGYIKLNSNIFTDTDAITFIKQDIEALIKSEYDNLNNEIFKDNDEMEDKISLKNVIKISLPIKK